MTDSVRDSYRACRRAARRSSSSFYRAFAALPSPQRRSMDALYAFFRRADDLTDDDTLPLAVRRQRLDQWRGWFDAALAGEYHDPLLPAVADTIARFDVPIEYFYEGLAGVAMDLDRSRYATFADLETYCYRVASAIGLACLHVWGFSDRAALEPARQCGYAFQLTNILRDLREDAARDRIYLPQEDLARFEYAEADLLAGVADERFFRLLDFEIDRAAGCYQRAAALEPYLTPAGQRIYRGLFGAYHALLETIRRRPREVLVRRVRPPWWAKLRVAARFYFPPRPKPV